MKSKKNNISKKNQIMTIFNKLFSKFSKRFTTSELLSIAHEIVEASYKELTYKIDFGRTQTKSNYSNSDVYSMISESPWEIVSRESNDYEPNHDQLFNTQHSLKNILNQ